MTRLTISLLSKDDFNDSVVYGMFASTVGNDWAVNDTFSSYKCMPINETFVSNYNYLLF